MSNTTDPRFGVTIFPTDYAIQPVELARAVEGRGFDELVFTLPDADADTVLPVLDTLAELIHRARG